MRAEELKNRLECFPIIAAIRDNTMTAAEAQAYGLIDHVLVPDKIKAKE